MTRGGRTETVSRVARLLELADLLVPWAIRVSCGLGVPDALADGPVPAGALAEMTGTNRHALTSLLRFLQPYELFVENDDATFALGPLGELLVTDLRFPLRMMLDPDGAQTRFGETAAHLDHAVRTGEAAYPVTFGRPFWEDLEDQPRLGAAFDELMGASAAKWVPSVVDRWDWSGTSHIVDVGGGAGDLVIGLLDAHPHLRATIVEQGHTADRARERLAAAGLLGRADVERGSFFEPLPADRDVYVLAQILHDWPDRDAARILDRVAAACGPSGRVLLVERVVDASTPEPRHVATDLLMVMLFGATERTLDSFGQLADRRGLALSSVTPLTGGLSLLELVPSSQARPADLPLASAGGAGAAGT